MFASPPLQTGLGETGAGDLVLCAQGFNVQVAENRILQPWQEVRAQNGDLILNAAGPNINCSGKTLVNVALPPPAPAAPFTKAMTPTSGVRTPLFTVTLPLATPVAVLVDWVVTMFSPNGVDTAVVSGRTSFSGANRAGSVTQSITDGLISLQVTQALAVVAVVSSATSSGNVITFGLTPSLTLFSAASMRVDFVLPLARGGTLLLV
jgi:hypothetical protein